MIKKIVASVITITLFSGCSAILANTNQQHNDKFIAEQNSNNNEEIAPEKAGATEQKNKKTKTPKSPEKKVEEIEKPNEVERPNITFAPNETEHVRLGYYNPFTNGNKIELNLDSLEGEFCYPYKGKPISRYGMRGRSMHTGLDIKAIPNDTIRCVMPGVVRMSKVYSGYGNVIVVRHYNGLESVYSHNTKNLVHPNDIVEAGTPLALAGRTGRATTEHVHFELRVKGEPFNPELMINPETMTLQNGTIYITNNNGKISASNSKYSVVVSQPTASSSSSPATSSKTSSKTHTIQKGDTLYKIAKQHGTTVKKLCEINKFSENKTLRIGEKIKVK